jgi:Gas vesicle synthesis protein GvpL/GvpF
MNAGSYLYGFTEGTFEPPPDLRGLRGAPVGVIAFADLGAVVSSHPVQRLMPARANVEPHHRVVRHVSNQAAMVPAAFGHVGESAADILDVLRSNYHEIRCELDRLAHKCEMGLKICWNVDNIFNHLVRTSRELRDARDRVFRGPEPSISDKLQLGATFEATLNSERQRLTPLFLSAIQHVTCDVFHSAPPEEKTICHTAVLIERARIADFETAMSHAAAQFDATISIDYSGPWPPYSFVRLRLRAPGAAAEA